MLYGVKVIVLSSLDSSCRDAGLKHLQRHHPHAVVLAYDFIEGNRLVRTVSGNAAAEYGEAVLEHPCIGCAVKFEIFPSIRRLAPRHAGATMILGLPATWHSGSVLETLAGKLESAGMHVGSCAISLDPAELDDHMWDRHTLWESGFSSMEQDQRTAGEYFFTEFMQADTLIPVEGMQAQFLEAPGSARRDGGADFAAGVELARQLAPHAALCHHSNELGAFSAEAVRHRTRPGHLPPAPTGPAPGTAPIHLLAERPLHPQRFREALSELAASCTCLRGRLWVASALSERVAIGGAGPRIWMENTGPWSAEIAASELLLYGSEHEAAQISKVFDDCQVTEGELQELLATASTSPNSPDQQGGE